MSISRKLNRLFVRNQRNAKRPSRRAIFKGRNSQSDLTLEALEQRLLLSVTSTLNNGEVTFDADADTSIFLRTDGDLLQWKDQGGSFSSDLDTIQSGDQTLTVTDYSSGTIKIDAADGQILTTYLDDINVKGANLEVKAVELEVNSSKTITTIGGTSGGDLKFEAKSITVQSGGSLLTDGSATKGAITLEAIEVGDDDPVDMSITLNSAIISGGDITILADAFSDSDVASDDDWVSSTLFPGVIVWGAKIDPRADAVVTVSGGTITGDSVDIDAKAVADGTINVITIFVGVGHGESRPTAKVNVKDGASIVSAGDVLINANANGDLAVETQRHTKVTYETKLYDEPVAVAVSVAYMEITSHATLSADSSIDANGNVVLDASSDKVMGIKAGTSTGRKGVLGTSIAISTGESDVKAQVDGTIVAGGGVTVSADLVAEKNDVTAQSQVGKSNFRTKIDNYKKLGAQKVLGSIIGAFSGSMGDKIKSYQSETKDFKTKFGFSAGWAWLDHVNTVTAGIGDDADVTAETGDVLVQAISSDMPELNAYSNVQSDAAAQNIRENAVSAAVSVGQLENNATAFIGNGATVNVDVGDLIVQSETRIPWEQQWWKWEGLSSISDKANFDLGIQNGFFSSWAEAYASGTKKAFGGSVNVLTIDNNSKAYIDRDASVTVASDTSVVALNENDTLNFAGQTIYAFMGEGTTSGGSGVGGAVLIIDYTNTINAKIKSGAVVDTGSLLVMARTDERNISTAVQGGSADEFAFNGAANGIIVDNQTRAHIDDGAQITTGALQVKVPRDYDTFDLENEGFFSDLPMFYPAEVYEDSDGNQKQRVDVSTNKITLPYDHGFAHGDIVYYTNGGGVDIGGLQDGNTYYVHRIDDSTVKLAPESNTQYFPPLDLTNTTGVSHTLYPGFNPALAITTDGDMVLDLGYAHNLADNQLLVYRSGDGNDIGNLVDGNTYYFEKDSNSKSKIKLKSTENGTPISLGKNAATGSGHFLIPVTEISQVTQSIAELTIRTINPLGALDSDGDGDVDTNDDHVVAITTDDYITDLSLLVIADDKAGLYSGTGGFTMGRSVGVGVSIDVANVHRQTEALIGNLEIGMGLDAFSAPGVGVDSISEFFLGYDHGLSQGDQVTYTSGGDFVIDGLFDGETYYVNIGTDSNTSGDPTFKLARSNQEANEAVLTRFALADIVDTLGADTINLGYTHKFQLGDVVRYDQGSGTEIGGLTHGESYYVIPIDSTTIALAATLGESVDEYHTLFDPKLNILDSEINFGYDHGFVEGQPVVYQVGGGTKIGGLTDGSVYYVKWVSDTVIKLQDSSNNEKILTPSSSAGRYHSLQPGITAVTANIDNVNEVIDLGYDHGFTNGQEVRYNANGGTPITNLNSGDVYFAIIEGEQRISLATSEAIANAARYNFFQSDMAVIDDKIDFSTPHGYSLNDPLVYNLSTYYSDPGNETITGMQYEDSANPGTFITMQEGQIYYAIPIDNADGAVEKLDNGSEVVISTEIKLSLSVDGPALKIVTTNAEGVHGFKLNNARININTTGSATDIHTFQPNKRLDLDATAGSGTTHTLRMALDPTTTMQITHGLGKTFSPSSSVSSNTVTISGFNHGFESGDPVVYSNGRGESIGGLSHGNIYYAVKTGDTSFKLAETWEKATQAEPDTLTLNNSVAVGSDHGFGMVIRATPIVDSQLDTINFRQGHPFDDGDTVKYDANNGTAIGGLTDGNTYTVTVIDSTTVKLNGADLDGTLAEGIGHALGQPDEPTGFVNSGGNAMVISNAGGEIVSVSLAASIGTKSKKGATSSGATEGENESEAKYGVSIAGNVSVHVVNDTTKAFIQQANITADDVDLVARNITEIYTGAGAVAIATATGDSKGIALAFSVNVIDNETEAYIDESEVTATVDDVRVLADNSGEIIAVAAGGAGVSGNFALAGSVVVNVVTSDTLALIKGGSDLTVADDMTVKATQSTEVMGVAGAISASIGGEIGKDQTGIGAALVTNVIANADGARAGIEDSDVDANGQILVSANDTSILKGIAAAIAISADSLNNVLAGAIGISVNVASTNTQAYIKRKKSDGVSGDEGVIVAADGDVYMLNVSGTGALSMSLGKSQAGGASLSVNIINNSVIAYIEEAVVTSSAGDIKVTANSTPTITSIAAGAAISTGSSLQGSFSINVLDNETRAYIFGSGSDIAADGNVLVSADDRLDIVTIAGTINIGGAFSGSSGTPNTVGLANST
ncbi:MAG: hypothetical protein GY869_32560, partial [Planctomycetes bacterium]|nr:hypothetical protein [Planctomycetota bacterium]